jgi:hypothetical protein
MTEATPEVTETTESAEEVLTVKEPKLTIKTARAKIEELTGKLDDANVLVDDLTTKLTLAEKGQSELASYRKFGANSDVVALSKIHGDASVVRNKLAALDHELTKNKLAVIKNVGFGFSNGNHYLFFRIYLDDKSHVSISMKEDEWKPFVESNGIFDVNTMNGKTCWVKISGETVSLIGLTTL